MARGRPPLASRTIPERRVTRERVRQTVVDYVKELIFDGQLKSGERVPQDELATALNVSNTPVREALIALEHEGLVTIEHHRGAFVNRLGAATIHDQYELFALLWGWAVQRAVAKASRELAAEISAIAAKIPKTTRDPDEFFLLMTVFVDKVELAGGSPSWRRLIDALPRLLPSPDFYQLVPGAMKAVSASIEDVADGIQNKDEQQAVDAIRRIMFAQCDALIAELDRRKLLVSGL